MSSSYLERTPSSFSCTWHFCVRKGEARTHNHLRLSLHSSNDSILQTSLVFTLSYFYSYRCSSKVTPLQQTLLQLSAMPYTVFSIVVVVCIGMPPMIVTMHALCQPKLCASADITLHHLLHAAASPATAAPHC